MFHKYFFMVFTFLVSILAAANFVEAAPTPATPNKQMQAVLDEQAKLGAKPIETLTPQEARVQPSVADAAQSLLLKRRKVPGVTGVTQQDLMIDGAAGKIPARLYFPETKKAQRPLIVYFHGGGWVIADIDTYEVSAKALAKGTDAIVLSVDYRKGPENKFPAAHDDAFAAYKWAVAQVAALGADPAHIAVAGESAGGGLAINVSMRARDEKIALPVHQLLIYPIAGADMNTPSYQLYADAKPLSKPAMEYFFKNYFNTMSDAQDPHINVVGANLQGLPPTTIIAAEIDPLQSEGEQLATLLKNQGVKVQYKEYKGVTHEFFGLADLVSESKAAQAFACQRLKASF